MEYQVRCLDNILTLKFYKGSCYDCTMSLLSKLKKSSLFLSSVAVKPGLSDRRTSSEGRLFRDEGQMKQNRKQ